MSNIFIYLVDYKNWQIKVKKQFVPLFYHFLNLKNTQSAIII